MTTTSVQTIATRLDQLLEISKFHDIAVNGLQVESPKLDVRKVGFAVDAGYSVIEAAALRTPHCSSRTPVGRMPPDRWSSGTKTPALYDSRGVALCGTPTA